MDGFRFVVEYDRELIGRLRMLEERMDGMLRALAEERGLFGRLRLSIACRFDRMRLRRLQSTGRKLAHRRVEHDGRSFDIDWERLGAAESMRLVEDVLEREREDARRAATP